MTTQRGKPRDPVKEQFWLRAIADQALARIGQLYQIEEACKDLSTEGRRGSRERDAVSLLTAFGEWLDEQSRIILPKSPVGQAISYARERSDKIFRPTLAMAS
jgi:transposase